MDTQLINVSEAARRLNTSRARVVRFINEGDIEDYRSHLDRRLRLVRLEDVERIRKVAITKRLNQPALAS